MTEDHHPALARVLETPGGAEAFEFLSTLSGSELTTALLGVFAQRSGRLGAGDVRRQYAQDRFVQPAPVSGVALARIELAALEAAEADGFATVGLSPVAPLGTHHVVAETPQNNVVSTARGSEVTADPTNSLALEACRRRGELLAQPDTRGTGVDLAATHRVTRAQDFSGPRSFAHFSLLGLVSAGRDRGDYRFELEVVARHLKLLVATIRAVTDADVTVRLSPFNTSLIDACTGLAADLASSSIDCKLWPEREHGRGYYRNLCFKVDAHIGGQVFELGDGGDVWWMQDLLQSRKERLIISGLGLERLALLLDEYP